MRVLMAVNGESQASTAHPKISLGPTVWESMFYMLLRFSAKKMAVNKAYLEYAFSSHSLANNKMQPSHKTQTQRLQQTFLLVELNCMETIIFKGFELEGNASKMSMLEDEKHMQL